MENANLAEQGVRDAYLEEVRTLARNDGIVWPDTSPGTHSTELYLHADSCAGADILLTGGRRRPWTPETFLERCTQFKLEPDTRLVCIVENITPSWIAALGTSWGIPPETFVEHARHPTTHPLWPRCEVDLAQPLGQSCALHGVYEYHDLKGLEDGRFYIRQDNFFLRHLVMAPGQVAQCSTRLSYCRVFDNLYLFLIDAPVRVAFSRKTKPTRARTTLRLPYSLGRGGIVIPQLFENRSYKLLHGLQSCLPHTWHYDNLFRNGRVINHIELLYLLSSSLWQSNLRFLSEDIKRTSFAELRDPDETTNLRLHDRREDLQQLKELVQDTIALVPIELDGGVDEDHVLGACRDLVRMHKTVLKKTTELERFLMDSFQLLMSSLSSKDSSVGLQQSRRAMLVTWLAFIYVPLSFVTGIFGMNVAQINDSKLSIWTCFVALVVIVGATVALWAVARYVQHWRKYRKVKRFGEDW